MNQNIDDIRVLLDRYYNGDSSPEDLAILTAYFTSCNDIPEDMEADRLLFLNINDAMPEIPASLSASIIEAIQKETARAGNRRYLKILRFAAAAAAISVVATVAVRIIPFGAVIDEQQHLMADLTATPALSDVKTISAADIVPTLPTDDKTDKNDLAISGTPPRSDRAVSHRSRTGRKNRPSEMTDEEAIRQANAAFALISSRLAKAGAIMEKASDDISECKEIITEKLNY